MSTPNKEIDDRTKRLQQLKKLELLASTHKMPLQTALNQPITVEQLMQLINSSKPEHNSRAEQAMGIWWDAIKAAATRESEETPPTNLELVQAIPSQTTQELNATREKLENWSRLTGVTLDQVWRSQENKTLATQRLQTMIDSTDEKQRDAAGLILEKWQNLIRDKATEMKRMQGATPKVDAPPRGLKIVENSVSEMIGVTEDEKQYVITLHNGWRETKLHTHQPAKPNLEYDLALAEHAQKWADHLALTSHWGHSDRTVFGFSGLVGENIYRGGFKGQYVPKRQMLKNAVDDWVAEHKNYNFEKYQPKSPNLVTGHFTQVVWRDTKKVGCGFASIERKDGFTYCYVVCCYFPPGNVIGHHNGNV